MRLCCTEKEKCKVLLIEDSDDFATAFHGYIEERGADGFEVYRARTYGEGLGMLSYLESDVIVLDLILPDLDQDIYNVEDLTKGLARLVPLKPRTAVVTVSGLMDDALGFRCVDLGAHDYLIKTELTPMSLVRALRYAVAHQRYRNRLLDICTELEGEVSTLRREVAVIRDPESGPGGVPAQAELQELSVASMEPLLAILQVADNIDSKVRVMRAS